MRPLSNNRGKGSRSSFIYGFYCAVACFAAQTIQMPRIPG